VIRPSVQKGSRWLPFFVSCAFLGYLLLFTGMVLTVIPLLRKGRTREQ